MRPMLAFKYQDYGHKLTYPLFVQPKLNGVRALFSSGAWQSRDEKLWKAPVLKHLTDQLVGVCPPGWILDGELYVHGWSLQQINSAIAINRNEPNEKTKEVEYHVFDIIDTSNTSQDFGGRCGILNTLSERLLANGAKNVRTVDTTGCDGLQESEQLYPFYRGQGYEGLMYRSADAPYGFLENCTNQENRWRCLLKRKDWLDDEFEITGFNTTEGEKGNEGFQLWCKAKNSKIFTIGSGLSDAERRHYKASPDQLIGKLARVKYEMLSDEGIPLKPTLEAILNDE